MSKNPKLLKDLKYEVDAAGNGREWCTNGCVRALAILDDDKIALVGWESFDGVLFVAVHSASDEEAVDLASKFIERIGRSDVFGLPGRPIR